MAEPVPELTWISTDYFVRVLEAYLHADVTVQRYELAAGCAGGQNFMSAIVRATVHYTLGSAPEATRPDSVSLILKTKLSNAELAQDADLLNVFGIEKCVYGPVLKGVRELLTSFGDCTQFAPRFIYEDDRALVLEDLAVKGFRQPDRTARLDLAHLRVIVKKLAKFHAATAVLERKNRELFSPLANSMFTSEDNPVHLFYANAIQHCIEQTERVPQLAQYSRFLREFLQSAIERESKSYERSTAGFNVLNHGDMWLNNLLWKYDSEGSVEDVIMVDYQESFFGSPAFDLTHLLHSSANTAIQRAGFDELLQLYTDELRDALRQFKYDGPLPDLAYMQAEVTAKRDHALIVTTCIVPPLITKETELATPENMLGDDEQAVRARQLIFSNPAFIEVLEVLLPRLAIVDGAASG
ncbi:AGAP003758-PA-like protein [Anopheles sinensis]|uniref:AGAP003758-PA-like protein n=1 Tax=Anopheles sinensis TaxID=74873 RepID=A0A084VUK3_ANOSI|nr:AGAP003758-PA-like protein [Anopheles sinensis]